MGSNPVLTTIINQPFKFIHMKKLLVILITAITLMSCGREKKAVTLPNGAVIEATNTSNIRYLLNAKVCVRKSSLSNWEICNDGEMQDTTYIFTYKYDGVNKTGMVTHKTGVISSHL